MLERLKVERTGRGCDGSSSPGSECVMRFLMCDSNSVKPERGSPPLPPEPLAELLPPPPLLLVLVLVLLLELETPEVPLRRERPSIVEARRSGNAEARVSLVRVCCGAESWRTYTECEYSDVAARSSAGLEV